jgi:hypothetical protein
MPHRSRPSGARTGILAKSTAVVLAASIVLSGCSTPKHRRSAAAVRAQIMHVLPSGLPDRSGWAADFYTAFSALDIDPNPSNVCAALAVTEQESGFAVDPVIPGLPGIARAEIERRARQHGVPSFVVRGALAIASHDGRRYDDLLDTVRTEQDLSRLFEELISSVPLGSRLFGGANPVRTGGPMQVSVAFAQQYERSHHYPYPIAGTIRQEVFSRRGGLYFGIAHLLDYPTSYTQPLYRFADYNAGFFASRNAAFQQAVSIASTIHIPLDGDLVRYDSGRGGSPAGATQMAVQSLAGSLHLSHAQIETSLRQGESASFERTELYRSVFHLAEQRARHPLQRAILPRITLDSPKITRRLTTQWFATRVNQRYRRCLSRSGI